MVKGKKKRNDDETVSFREEENKFVILRSIGEEVRFAKFNGMKTKKNISDLLQL